jgi:hypothetical protein
MSYADALDDARRKPEKFVRIRDGHDRGAGVIHDGHNWWIVDLEHTTLTKADRLALVRLNPPADPEEGLSQVTLACDLDGPGIWLVDAGDLEDLAGYGDHLEIVWTG